MENINIISLGNFKINNREFFRNILNADEIYRKKIRGIYGGERIIYKNLKSSIEYINSHFIIDYLNFKEINNKVKLILSDKENIKKTLILYFIDQFDENIGIIKELGEKYKENFCVIYIDDSNKKRNKKFLEELNNIINVDKLIVEGKDFYFNINKNNRIEFEKILIKFYFVKRKRNIIEGFSSFCIRNIYSILMEKDKLTKSDILKISEKFKLDLENKLIKDINLFNNEINKIKREFGIEYLSNIQLIRKEDVKRDVKNRGVLEIMAKKINQKQEKNLKEKILITLKIKKEKIKKNNELEKKLINESIIQKERVVKSLEMNNKYIKI